MGFHRKLDVVDTSGKSQGIQKKKSQVILKITKNQIFLHKISFEKIDFNFSL